MSFIKEWDMLHMTWTARKTIYGGFKIMSTTIYGI